MAKWQEMYEFDDDTRVVTIRNMAGASHQRPYSDEENAAADQRMAQTPEAKLLQLQEVVDQLVLDQLMNSMMMEGL